jgi:predicted pyridoxine 5'-phosphate oxidase superfamily flavin-nucleotide-binding protein
MSFTSDIAFTATVKRAQAARGSRETYQRHIEKRDWPDRITPELAQFVAERTSVYLATTSVDGQPYIQHRGGPPGFLKVLDDRTLGFADFAGNRQYITLGNLEDNDRAFLFLMDYRNRRRIKVWGRARVVEDDAALLEKLRDPDYPGRPERAVLFEVTAWDVNCSQHIPVMVPEAEIDALKARVAALEAEVQALRGVAG